MYENIISEANCAWVSPTAATLHAPIIIKFLSRETRRMTQEETLKDILSIKRRKVTPEEIC